MKLFLIISAFGFVNADKLHRAYLPPSNAESAGGRPEDLQTPLELPKETYFQFSANDKQKKVENLLNQNGMNLNGNLPNNQTLEYDAENREAGTNLSLKKIHNSVLNDDQEVPLDIQITQDQGNFERNTFGPDKGMYSSVQESNDRNQYIPKSIDKINTRFEANFVSAPTAEKESINTDDRIPIVNGSFEEYNHIKQTPKSQSITETFNEDKITSLRDDANSEISGVSIPLSDSNKPEEFFVEKFSRDGDPTSNYLNQRIDPTVREQSISNYTGNLAILQNAEYPERNKQIIKNGNDSSLLKNIYPSHFSENFRNKYLNTANRPQTENDRKAALLSFENLITPEGFSYAFDTSNGIHADESGTAIGGVKAKGSYSYTGDDGKIYRVTYTADERGFQPKGDHINPLPNSIKALIEKTTADGIYDDGSYSEEKYGHMRYQGPVDRYYSQIHMKTRNRQRKPANKETNSFNRTQYLKNNTNSSEKLATTSNSPFIIDTNKSFLPYKINERSQTSTLRSRPKNIIGNQYPNAELKGSENIIKNSQDNSIVGNDDLNINDIKLGKLKTPTIEIIKEIPEKQLGNMLKQIAVSADPINSQTINPTEIPDYFTTEFNSPLNFISNDHFIMTARDGKTGYTYTKPKYVFKEGIISAPTDDGKERYVSVNDGERNVYTSSVDVLNDLPTTQESTSPQNPILRSKFTSINNPYLTTEPSENRKLFQSSLTPTLFMPSTTPMPSLNKYIEGGIIATGEEKSMGTISPASIITGYYSDNDLDLNTASDRSFTPTTSGDEAYDGRTNFPYLTTEQDTKLLGNNYDPNYMFSVRVPVNVFGNKNFMQIDNDDPLNRKTDEVIGEDFRGPKQPQSFDPDSSYHY